VDYTTLLGAEGVERAGRNMQSAAEHFDRCMFNFDAAVDRLIRALDEHASRIEAAIKNPPVGE
jgi:hypothetical protein